MMTLEFQGTDRYAIRRRLGSGGMGVVYEAFDRSRGERVALKTLLRADAAAIFRFKREFRTLANLVHPNLVSLYELHADSDQWFFTMELVEGVTFVKYVRPRLNGNGGAGTRRLDVARLRTSLRQLAEGVQALHDAGIVHCDIKPSNILVTADGRVRLFDFGIASEIAAPSHDVTMRTDQFGTPHYMAPEQAAGGMPAMASDWYGVGVVLYEALTGQLPYSGDNLSVVLQKLHDDPPPPETLATDLPLDLCEICRGLMVRHAVERLGGTDLLARLGTGATVSTAISITPPGTGHAVVGRDAHLAALTAAHRDVRGGQTVSIYVHGESGWGKSTIVNRFLDDVATQERTVVLAGRCYERESMPYKGLDGVIDRLTTFLRTLPYERVEALLPRDVLAVARLFPVLRRVDAIANAPLWDVELPDPVEVRRRAIAALRELLARLADRYMLVVFIDDLQWADADSIALLDHLLTPPSAPPLLLVAALRSEDVDQRPFLKTLLQRADGDVCRLLAVGPLTDEDSRRLVRSLLGSTASDRLVDSITRESGGSPFLLEQLTYFVLESDTSAASAIALREMLDSRLARLPEGARRLLEVLAVARHPVDAASACRAADLGDSGRPLVSALRSAQMLRSAADAFEIDVYHDRIRQAIASALDEDVIRSIHLRLATALCERPGSDPATLFEHYLGAGAHDLARTQALAAAERAVASLAFDRAARFYRHALALQSTGSADAGALRAKLGDALASAGRPAEAAEAYLAACEDADHAGALELRRRAAEQLLFGGHNDRGLQAMRELLNAVGLRIPSQQQTILALLAGRLRLRLRGYGHRERSAADLPQRDLLRLDTCGACAMGLSLVDPVLAAYFGSRFLLLALGAGEPLRIARALAMEVGFTGSRGGLPDRRTEQLLAQSLAMAERVGSARELGLALVTAGSSRVLRGQWKKSVELLLRADQLLRERCTGVQWELTTGQSLLLSALMYLGEITEAAWRLPLMLGDAQERGNLYAATEARTRANFCWLALDQADRARQEASEALERWSRHGFHRQHHNALIAHVNIDLYNGDAATARQRVEAHWPVVSRTLMMRVQLFRVETEFLRARAALAMAATNPTASETLLRFSETRAAGIRREKMPWADPFVPLVRATVSAIRGHKDAAVADLGTAAAGFDAADMGLYAAMTRRRLGQLLGGSKGDGLLQAADLFMTSHGVRRPDRLANVMVPGVWT